MTARKIDVKPKQKIPNPRLKELKFTLKKMMSSPLSLIGSSLVIAFVIIAALAPILAPQTTSNPFTIPHVGGGFAREPLPPNAGHPFGTGQFQIDLYYGCIWGTIHAFRLGLLIIGGTLVIGLALGLVAGFYGGIIDEVIMRFTDIILAFPGLILIMALVVALTTAGLPFTITGVDRLDAAIIGLVLVGWPGYTRLIRGEVLRVKSEDYVEASRASGSSDIRIIVRHILPNSIYPIIIVASLDFGSIVLTTAALSFLGLGAPPGYSDWGQLIYASTDWIASGLKYWWTFTFPGLFIVLFVLGWNLLGDAFRDILDPLYRRK
jgi:peptide/nickel transport system permease protein